uniref:uncharacterized protein LOC120348589 isoform X1 n=1 Tax=Styela clava TaxID=7725 RepID=UPI00193A9292|nr:uncharacterized protein LOC120348589 isoform X1 [Styela clava]
MIINLAWLILLCCSLISSSPNIVKAIQCKSSCYNVIEMIKLKDGRYLTCKARGIKHPPRPSKNDSTAVSPQNENLTWYVTKGTEKRIALNITWSLRESYIPKQGNLRNFRGFYLTVGWTNLALRYIARVKINKKKLKHDILIEQNKNSTDIFFSYECYGTKYQFIRPNDNLQVTYSSIPLAKWEDNRQTKIKIIKIPDPNQHNPKNKYKQEQTSNHTKMNSTEISHNLTISTSYFQISKDDYIIW